MFKTILYIVIFLIVIWAMEGLNINGLFKQSRIAQARIIYLFISISITYLVVNFLYDLVISFQIIK